MGVRLAVVAALVAAVSSAAAQRPPKAMPEATVDWGRGLVIASAVGTADRRAPSPAVGRVGALREAEDRARADLVAKAAELAPGVAVDGAPLVDLATDYLPDGSVRIRRGLPIEAIRQAQAGPRAIAPAWDGAAKDDAPRTIVVDARNLDVDPRVGIAVSDGATTHALPAVWVNKAPREKGALKLSATAVDGAGALVVAPSPDLDRAASAGALLVVVIRE